MKYYNLELVEVPGINSKMTEDYYFVESNRNINSPHFFILSENIKNKIDSEAQLFDFFYECLVKKNPKIQLEIEEKINNELQILKYICENKECQNDQVQRYLVEYLVENLKVNRNVEYNVIPHISKDMSSYSDLIWFLHANIISGRQDCQVYYFNSYDDLNEYHVIGDLSKVKIKEASVEQFDAQELKYYIENKPVQSRHILRLPRKYKIQNNIINDIRFDVKLKSKFNKNILFMDRIDAAGDSAEALYDYCINKQKLKNCYFAIGNEEEYARLSAKYPNIIRYGSSEFDKIYLSSKLLVSSGLDKNFENYNQWRYPRTKVKAKYFFLQHGYINDDLSDWLFARRFNKMIVSDEQEGDLVKSYYSIYPEQIVVSGLPRFDKLKPEKSTVLLVAPTWRYYIKNETEFKNSLYIKKWNEVLQSEVLQEYCRANNLEIVLKIHPEFLKYEKYFNLNSTTEAYSELFKKSHMLITDYSSIFYDMHMMNKQTIFYQFDEQEFYENHTYSRATSYKDLGIGKVIEDIRQLPETLEELSKRSSTQQINDYKNCERAYKIINELL